MAIQLNGWQRIGVVLSVGWALFLLGMTVVVYFGNEDFHADADRYCAAFTEHVFVSWRDVKTGGKLTIYRDGEHFLNCEDANRRAEMLIAKAERGTIEPVEEVEYLRLVFAIFFPIITCWTLAYCLYMVFKWIVDGFRRR